MTWRIATARPAIPLFGWAILLAGSAFAPAEDWPQWRGAGRDGHVSSLPATMPAMKVLWRRPVAGACDAGLSVAGGVLVMADHDDANDYYSAIDAATGQEIWKRTFPNGREMDYGSGPRATPLIFQDKVYVLGAFGDFTCLRLSSGITVWQVDFARDFAVKKVPTWGYCSSPLLAQGRLVVNPGGKAALAALDPATGQVVWQTPGEKANYSSFVAGQFGGVEQVVGYDAKSLGGWELKSGKRLWTIEIESSGGFIVPTPVKVGGNLFVADSNNFAQFFAFDQDGAIRETPIATNGDLAPEVSTAVAVGDLILGQSEKLVCLDAANPANTLWIDEEEEAFRADCHLIVSGERGLAFNSEGMLVLFHFDHQGVKVLGKRQLCQKTLMHPTVAGGRLYLRDSQFLYCYDLSK